MRRTTLAVAVLAGFAAAPAMAADPIAPTPYVPSPVSPVSAHDWSGFYAGVSVGYGWATSNADLPDQEDFGAALHAGYNYDFGDWVAGVRGEFTPTAFTDVSAGDVTLGHSGRVTGQLGMKFGETGSTLAYVLGGVGIAQSTNAGVDYTDFGWTVGAGLSQAITESVSVSGEVSYGRFDNVSGTTFDVEGVGAAIGVSYHF